MHRADLTPTELADILHQAYLADLGDDVDAPGPSLRASLADPPPGATPRSRPEETVNGC